MPSKFIERLWSPRLSLQPCCIIFSGIPMNCKMLAVLSEIGIGLKIKSGNRITKKLVALLCKIKVGQANSDRFGYPRRTHIPLSFWDGGFRHFFMADWQRSSLNKFLCWSPDWQAINLVSVFKYNLIRTTATVNQGWWKPKRCAPVLPINHMISLCVALSFHQVKPSFFTFGRQW